MLKALQILASNCLHLDTVQLAIDAAVPLELDTHQTTPISNLSLRSLKLSESICGDLTIVTAFLLDAFPNLESPFANAWYPHREGTDKDELDVEPVPIDFSSVVDNWDQVRSSLPGVKWDFD